VTVDREEITVLGTLSDPVDDQAQAEGRISRFRADTRDERISIAREAQQRFQRQVSWGARSGEVEALFTHLAVPVMWPARAPTPWPGRCDWSASTPRSGSPSCVRR
jgi:hypothetical protein